MTYYQETLLEEAKDMWERGFSLTLDLAARLQSEGFDVEALEMKFKKED
jgi:hypothetical protein